MITITCTESEKRKLCKDETNIMCEICYALGACKEFDESCSKCKRYRGKYIKWNIIPAPKKKAVNSEGDGSSCCNCYWNCAGTCKNEQCGYYKMSIESVMDIVPLNHCSEYSAHEGDG